MTIETSVQGDAYVAQYLSEHPDFFLHHRDLVAQLAIPHESGTISLVERQVKVLRDRNRDLQSQMIEMLRHARENEHVLSQCLSLSVAMIESAHVEALVAVTRDELLREFHCDALSVIFCQIDVNGVIHARTVKHDQMLNEIGCGFPDGEAVCGYLDIGARKFLFGDLNPDLQSVALLPLGMNAARGVIAIASRDRNRFSPQMGTVFLQLISQLFDVIHRKLAREGHIRVGVNS